MDRNLITRKEVLFLILKIILLTFTTSSASILPSDFSSEGSLIFGPYTFLREKGARETERRVFTLGKIDGLFYLRLSNGSAEGDYRVSSAHVKLNGKEIFRPFQFNQRVAILNRQVSLEPGENLLEVELRGAPGSFITIEIFRLPPKACSIFGPYPFIRDRKKPGEETINFDLSSQFIGPYLLNLTNGNQDGSNRVDSATIRLNETVLFDPNVFNEKIDSLSREVSLLSVNTLSIKLMGAPGDFLTVDIRGYDIIPPEVTITHPWNIDVLTGSSITIEGIVNDPFASVTVNGTKVSVSSDGTFTLPGFTLSEGENIINIVAIDPCGNRGEDQIVVYRRTVSQGPYLLFCPEIFLERPPDLPEPGCSHRIYEKYIGTIAGLTDKTATEIIVDGVLFPDGVLVEEEGRIYKGKREGNFFWAFVSIPQVDGIYPFSAVVINAEGGQTEATVYFLRDTVPPLLTISSPTDGFITNTPEITIRGTVDDPEGMVRIGWYGSWIPVVDGSFTATYTLFEEGSNYVTVTARDPAENYAYLTYKVILDTQPPEISISYPADGEVVKTRTLNVKGNIIDANGDTVTVEINGNLPQLLNLTGLNFSGNVTLNPGTNSLVFSAVDKAGNSTRITRTVILDTDTPTIVITSPVPGAIISGTLTIEVESSDITSRISSVALLVDGEPKTILFQAPFNFKLDTLPLSSGLHILTVRSTDVAGNEADASVEIIVDNIAPIVVITSPLPDSFVSGPITVSVQASDAISGVASVSLYVDGELHSTLNQPPFNFFVDTSALVSGSHTLIAKVLDQVGNQAEETVTIIVRESFRVEITSPANGATINKVGTVIQGRIFNPTGEVGVVVNGVLAEVQGDYFAVQIPLQTGENIITAIAKRSDGLQGQSSIIIHTETQEETIRLTPRPESGTLDQLGVLNVTLEVEIGIQNPVVSISWDIDGDGNFESMGNETSCNIKYQSPGIYLPKVRVTDDQGNVYEERTLVNVLSREEMDALLKSKWEGMKAKLFDKDLTSAMEYFIEPSREVYQRAFEVIKDDLPGIVNGMRDIEPIFIRNNVAEYRIERLHRFEDGTEQTVTYYIYFVKDRDGLWRIDRF